MTTKKAGRKNPGRASSTAGQIMGKTKGGRISGGTTVKAKPGRANSSPGHVGEVDARRVLGPAGYGTGDQPMDSRTAAPRSAGSARRSLTPAGYGTGDQPMRLDGPGQSPLERQAQAAQRRSVAAWLGTAQVVAHDAEALRSVALDPAVPLLASSASTRAEESASGGHSEGPGGPGGGGYSEGPGGPGSGGHSEGPGGPGGGGQRGRRKRRGRGPSSAPSTAGARSLLPEEVLTRLRQAPTAPGGGGVRLTPEYFETFEHKAIAENLQGILLGGDPLHRADTASHALLRLVPGADANRPAFMALRVQSLDAAWRSAYAQQLQELTRNVRLVLPIPLGHGVSLSYGEVVALAGDFYGTLPELLQGVTPAIAAEVHRVTPQSPGANWLTLRRGLEAFLKLAFANTDHFYPHNWARYAHCHAQALLHALDRRFDAALLANAFADHFLTDAFAAGHLRTPREPGDGATEALHARLMHNEENTQGLWVRNGEGLVWHAYGDDKLGFNPVHLLQTAVALGQSMQRVLRAYRLEGPAAAHLRTLAEEALQTLPAAPVNSAQLPQLPQALPALLGPCGDAALQSMMALLPVPLSASIAPLDPDPGVLCNYAPMYRPRQEGGKRRGQPNFAQYFLQDGVQSPRA